MWVTFGKLCVCVCVWFGGGNVGGRRHPRTLDAATESPVNSSKTSTREQVYFLQKNPKRSCSFEQKAIQSHRYANCLLFFSARIRIAIYDFSKTITQALWVSSGGLEPTLNQSSAAACKACECESTCVLVFTVQGATAQPCRDQRPWCPAPARAPTASSLRPLSPWT